MQCTNPAVHREPTRLLVASTLTRAPVLSMSRPGLSALAVLAFATPLVACFTYDQVAVGANTPTNLDVRVEIEPTTSSLITAAVGPRVSTLEGRTVTADDSSLTVSVRTITRTASSEENWNGDAVRIPRAAIARVERRRLDPIRTGLIVGGVVGAAILAGHAGTSAPTAVIKTGGSGNGT